MITYKDVAEKSMTSDKKASAQSDLFAFYVIRPISFFATIPFLYTSLTPNMISMISIIPVMIGFVISWFTYSKAGMLLSWLMFYAVTVLTLSAMYKFIPAVPVRYRNALIGALVAGLLFVIFQFLYLQTQMFVTRINGVYGTIAAVPLFLIWLNYSWSIVIYGAQLSFAIQNVDTYNLSDDLTFIQAVGADRETRMAKRRSRQ